METLKYMHRGPPVAAVEMAPHVPSVPSRKVSTVGRALQPPPNSALDASSAPVLPFRKVPRARAPLPQVPISPEPLQRQQQEMDADITLQVPQGLARHNSNNSHTRDKDPNGDLSPPPPPPRRAKSAERIRRPGAQQEGGSFSPQSLSYSQVPVPSSHRSNRSHVGTSCFIYHSIQLQYTGTVYSMLTLERPIAHCIKYETKAFAVCVKEISFAFLLTSVLLYISELMSDEIGRAHV